MTISISLPLPDHALSPNKRAYWAAKARAAKKARRAAKEATAWAVLAEVHSGASERIAARKAAVKRINRYSLTYYHAVSRKRDDDNLIAQTKAYRDGMADALGIDDNQLRIEGTPTQRTDKEAPRLVITMWESKE